MFILTQISRKKRSHADRFSYCSKPQAATNFTNRPDGLREIRSTEGALCDRFLLLSFVKFRVIRVEMNKLNTCES